MSSSPEHLAVGDGFVAQYWTSGDVSTFEYAIQEYESALGLAQDKSEDKVRAQMGLADALRLEYEEGLAGEDAFNRALALLEDAVECTGSPSLLHLEAMRGVGELLLRRFHSRGYLDRAEETLRTLVQLSGDSQSRLLVKALSLHAYALLVQYVGSRNSDLLLRANSAVDRALAQADSQTDPDLTVSLTTARYLRFMSSKNPNDIEESIQAMQALIARSPVTSPRLHWYWSLLSRSYSAKLRMSGSSEDMDAEINALEEATRRVGPNHPLWPIHFSNFAATLNQRFVSRTRLEDLFESTAVLRKVLEHALRTDFSGTDVVITNLADCLVDCYAQTGKLDFLDEGISLQLDRLQRASMDRRGGEMNTLARAYSVRFAAHGRMSDLESAISLQEEALKSVDADLHWGEASHDLARDLMTRYKELGQIQDVERAIEVLRAALSEQAPGAKSMVLSMLGVALCARSVTTDQSKDPVECVRLQQEAMDLLPEGHSRIALCNFRLGLAEYESYNGIQDLAVLRRSIVSFQRALSIMPPDHPERALYLIHLANSQFMLLHVQERDEVQEVLDTLSLAAGLSSSPVSDRYIAAAEWAKQAHRTGRLDEAIEAYSLAISLLPELAWLGLEDELRTRRLGKQAPDLCQDAAACAIELGRYELAVELSERGRTILWNSGQELRVDLARLKEAAPDLARELDQTSAALTFRPSASDLPGDESAVEAERQRIHRLAAQRKELLDAVRNEAGFGDFLLPATFATVSQAASHGPVVILNSSVYRSDALIIRPDRIVTLIALPAISNDQIKREVMLLQHLLRLAKDTESLRYLEAVLAHFLRRLWESIGRRVYVELQVELSQSAKPRVWWCPTGALSFIPIHACGPYDGGNPGMADLVISSYSPTLSALVRSRRRSPISAPQKLSLLAIAEPNIPGRTPLPCSLQEVETIKHVFGRAAVCLVGAEATVKRIQTILPRFSWLHVSSHGTQDATNPLKSSIALFDGPLTLSSLAQANLPAAEFAFLSACHSARGTPQMPDESMHLAAGTMFAGYRSVVATSWAVADQDAPRVTKAFYEYLSRGERMPDVTETAEALHVAVRSLRMSGVALYRWVPFIHLGA